MPKVFEKERLAIKCRNCGYTWTPNPKRWRNTVEIDYLGNPVKVLYCPNCTTRNYMSREDVKELLRWYMRNARKNTYVVAR